MSLFLEAVVEDGYTTYNITSAGYGLMIAIIIALMLVACYFTNSDNKVKISSRQLVFSAMCMALAMITSMIKIFHMPMGGSVTLFSMFFITFIGYLYGPRTGLTAAFAYGCLQLIIDPYIVSIPQLMCDYILAFGIMGISGFFAGKKYGLLTGYFVGIFGRFVFSVLSGVIFFADYAPEGMNPVVYSVAYNGAYIGAEAILTMIVIAVPAVHSALNIIKNLANEPTLRTKPKLV